MLFGGSYLEINIQMRKGPILSQKEKEPTLVTYPLYKSVSKPSYKISHLSFLHPGWTTTNLKLRLASPKASLQVWCIAIFGTRLRRSCFQCRNWGIWWVMSLIHISLSFKTGDKCLGHMLKGLLNEVIRLYNSDIKQIFKCPVAVQYFNSLIINYCCCCCCCYPRINLSASAPLSVKHHSNGSSVVLRYQAWIFS